MKKIGYILVFIGLIGMVTFLGLANSPESPESKKTSLYSLLFFISLGTVGLGLFLSYISKYIKRKSP